MTRGDIILIPFPFSDLSGQKVRPSLVLYADKDDRDMIVAFFTSNIITRGKYDLVVKATKWNNLKVESILRLVKLATIEKKMALGLLGKIEDEYMAMVHKNLHEILGFE